MKEDVAGGVGKVLARQEGGRKEGGGKVRNKVRGLYIWLDTGTYTVGSQKGY